jgi:hypothetical protein
VGRKKDRGKIKARAKAKRSVKRGVEAICNLTEDDLDRMTEETLAEKKYLGLKKNHGPK